MLVALADDRAEHCHLVEHSCHPRQQLADLHAGDLGGDRPELAPNLFGGFRLQVERVLMRQAARQVDHDHGLVRPARTVPCRCLGTQQLGERQAPQRQTADLEERPARDAVAITVPGAEQRQHDRRNSAASRRGMSVIGTTSSILSIVECAALARDEPPLRPVLTHSLVGGKCSSRDVALRRIAGRA